MDRMRLRGTLCFDLQLRNQPVHPPGCQVATAGNPQYASSARGLLDACSKIVCAQMQERLEGGCSAAISHERKSDRNLKGAIRLSLCCWVKKSKSKTRYKHPAAHDSVPVSSRSGDLSRVDWNEVGCYPFRKNFINTRALRDSLRDGNWSE